MANKYYRKKYSIIIYIIQKRKCVLLFMCTREVKRKSNNVVCLNFKERNTSYILPYQAIQTKCIYSVLGYDYLFFITARDH